MDRFRRGASTLALILLLSACHSNGATEPTATSTTGTITTTSTSAVSTTEPAGTTTTSTTPPTSTAPTTVPPDGLSPELVITAPQPGQTVTTRTYRFEGTTDPGCAVVAAGRYDADVDAAGKWSIVLVLDEGANVAKFVATDPAGNITRAQITIIYSRPAGAIGSILVSNDSGVFSIDSEFEITQLVDGRVAFAVDDTRGGLLFQIDGGRKVFPGAGYVGDPPRYDPQVVEGLSLPSTAVWWLPKGASTPRQLLVPTPHAGHSLSLHDAYQTSESFAVVYTRHEGALPFDTDTAEADMADTLRVFDPVTQEVTQVYRVRGYEWDLTGVAADGGLITATENGMLGSGCRVFDGAGRLLTLPGAPTATQGCFNETTVCPTHCVLSTDTTRVAYLDPPTRDDWDNRTIVVRETDHGVELARLEVDLEGWSSFEIDIQGDLLLVNRQSDSGAYLKALLFRLDGTGRDPRELPVAGRARFAKSLVHIASPIPAPSSGPVYVTFGSLGVFRVESGVATRVVDDPAAWAAGDGLGGVLFVSDPGTLRHLAVGASAAVTVGSNLSPSFVGWVEGEPTLVMLQMNRSCERWDVVLWDVASGERRVFASCVLSDAVPRAVGGSLVASVDGAGGAENLPRMRLVFRDLTGDEIEVAHNPWPEPCAVCRIDALLSPDGAVLAVAEIVPHPQDLGVSDWAEFGALDPADQRSRWESYLPISTVRLRTISLDTGYTSWSTEMGVGSLLDFDGRYLAYRFGGMGHHSQFPYNTHLFDTWEDQELPVVWGTGELPGEEQQDIDLIPTMGG